jgi:hypothetical protein
MKNYIPTLGLGLTLLGMTWMPSNVARADSDDRTTQTTTTSTISSQGTISEFAPDSFMIRSSASAVPVRYSYTKSTTYVDEGGNPVSIATVRSGVPVTVYYDRSGNQMIASKVVVRQAVPASSTQSTTTTTTKKDDD